jgi:hypothetical protein
MEIIVKPAAAAISEEQNFKRLDEFSALLLKVCHSFQYPLEGYKKQENGEYF